MAQAPLPPGTEDEDVRDAQLFRLWCRLASTNPMLVAKELTHCLTPDEYRAALMRCASATGINLPATDADPYVCVHCGARSYNRNDRINRYCGRCHRFADEP